MNSVAECDCSFHVSDCARRPSEGMQHCQICPCHVQHDAWSAYKLCYCSVGEKEQAWQLRQLGFRLALLIVLVFSDAVPALYEVW